MKTTTETTRCYACDADAVGTRNFDPSEGRGESAPACARHAEIIDCKELCEAITLQALYLSLKAGMPSFAQPTRQHVLLWRGGKAYHWVTD